MSSERTAKRIGVFGGTFDPVHIGHLVIATELAEALALDRVIFVPAGQPPHKAGLRLSPDADRLAMLDLAIADNSAFARSTIELERPGPSYTVDLLAMLTEQYAGTELVFLMGEDSLRDFSTWRDPAAIVRLAELGVALRPGVVADLEAVYRRLPEARGRIHVVPATQIEISSSSLRQRIREGRSIRYQVPEAVWRYITARGLYRGE